MSIPIDVEKSFHYSRARTRVFIALEHGPSYPTALARAARVDLRTLRGVMIGEPPRYHRERGLVSLGLAELVEDTNGAYYQLTRGGRRVLAAMRGAGAAGTSVPDGPGGAAGTIVPASRDLAPAGPVE